MTIAQLVVPEHLQQAFEMIERKVAGIDRTVHELEIFAKDGRRVPLEVSTRLIRQDGRPAVARTPRHAGRRHSRPCVMT